MKGSETNSGWARPRWDPLIHAMKAEAGLLVARGELGLPFVIHGAVPCQHKAVGLGKEWHVLNLDQPSTCAQLTVTFEGTASIQNHI